MAEIRKQTGLHDETPFNLKWLDVEGKGEDERGRGKGEGERGGGRERVRGRGKGEGERGRGKGEGERGRGKGEEGERMWWKLKERTEEEGGRRKIAEGG